MGLAKLMIPSKILRAHIEHISQICGVAKFFHQAGLPVARILAVFRASAITRLASYGKYLLKNKTDWLIFSGSKLAHDIQVYTGIYKILHLGFAQKRVKPKRLKKIVKYITGDLLIGRLKVRFLHGSLDFKGLIVSAVGPFYFW